MTVATATRIGLEVHCRYDSCTQFAQPLLAQLANGYDECAVLSLEGVDEWRRKHRTARKRADRAGRRGYWFGGVTRHERADEIAAINTSTTERQGRRMSVGYWAPPSRAPDPAYRCERHAVYCYGVYHAMTLVGYSWIYRAGDLALVSQILGHHDHLANEIMYLLVQGVVEAQSPLAGSLVYNRYDSGTEGLRFFKDRCGFDPVQVEWSQW